MGKIINLRSVRKARARDEKEVAAEENRRRFGRKKAERETAKDLQARLNAALDGARLTPDP